jgi:GxxExxY protein
MSDTRKQHDPLPEETNAVSKAVLNGAYVVHSTLGPGLFEDVYEVCLCHELSKANLKFQRQLPQPVLYDGIRLGVGYKIDVLVEGKVLLELKSVEEILPVHKAQLLTYLKLSGIRLGLLINFNVPMLKDGISRMVL